MSEDQNTNEVQMAFRVPEYIREAAKRNTAHGELSQVFRDVARSIAFGEDIEEKHAQKRALEEIEDTVADLRQERERINTEIAAQEAEADRIRKRVEQADQSQAQYDARLEELEIEKLQEGHHVFEALSTVERAADTIGVPPGQVIETLQERNPGYPDIAFTDPATADQWFDGFDDDGVPIIVNRGDKRGGRR